MPCQIMNAPLHVLGSILSMKDTLIVMLCTIHLMSFYCGNGLLVYLPINNNNNNNSLPSKDCSLYITLFSWR